MDTPTLVSLALGLSGLMLMAWVIQQATRSSGLVDTIWTLAVGIGGVAAVLLPASSGVMERRIMAGILVAAWALRLGLHILKRNGNHDDPRYEKLTRDWGPRAPLYMFAFLQIQAVAAFVLVLSVRLAAVNASEFPSWRDIAGVLVIAVAVVGESVADAQLARFGRQHRGEKAVCDVGLWAWSRHPNYFFEWLGWAGWAVIAVDPAHAWSFLALLAPLQMYYLLVYASGIPPLEQHMLSTRGDLFRAYQKRTSAFFPLPPKKEPR